MNLKRLLLILLSIITYVAAYPEGFVYSKYTVLDGLNDNHVQHILQLSDGRMAFTTLGNINLYDGYRFQTIHFNGKDIDRYTLSNYKGLIGFMRVRIIYSGLRISSKYGVPTLKLINMSVILKHISGTRAFAAL